MPAKYAYSPPSLALELIYSEAIRRLLQIPA